jgi:hypothetical protein
LPIGLRRPLGHRACFNVIMRRFTASNTLTAATLIAGAASSAAAAAGETSAQGIALGAAIAFGSLLVRSIARDSATASRRQDKVLKTTSERLAAVSEQVAFVERKVNKRIDTLGQRTERENSTMTLRILSDINAARLEQIDASLGPAATNGRD